ncbi:MAG TPA: type I pullulanase [bacterium]|nr:type I pullulanase [bacterium]
MYAGPSNLRQADRGVAGWCYVFIVWLLLTLWLAPVGARAAGDILTVHYGRPGGDYADWTLWTWNAHNGQDSRELKADGKDDFGLVFHVTRADYGDGTQIGLLPKYREWASKDPPDRIWMQEMGNEVWILAGNPGLFKEKPSEDLMGKQTGPTLTVHYHRPQGDYQGWTLWTWNDENDQDSREIYSSAQDDFGIVFKVDRKNYGEGNQIGLLPKFGNWSSKDAPDRIWYPYMGAEVWIVSSRDQLYTKLPDTTPWIVGAFVDAARVVTVSFSTPLKPEDLKPSSFTLTDDKGQEIKLKAVRELPPKKGSVYLVGLTLDSDLDVRAQNLWAYTLAVKGFKPAALRVRSLLDDPAFQSDKALGWTYSPGATTFRVFAPTASSVKLLLYDKPVGGAAVETGMQYAANGVWEATVAGDLKGRYYTLKAAGSDPGLGSGREVIDPYSKCNTAHDGRGLVFVDSTRVAAPPQFDVSQAIIYELHVRDFTIDPASGVKNKGKYLGFTEAGTTMPGDSTIKTGLDHLQELGVNVVHIMPIQDFENDESKDTYNWGYMPVHFDSPDGWYATQKYNASRVEEFKRLVDALHKKGIKVVMDVVYNHTAEARPSKVFSFEGLVPGYYYRLKDDGTYWNGSGTGNETRSEAPMMRKFILDSVKYWVETYGVDGFRFDLMGLMDIETATELVIELKAIKPDIIVYGEPWAGGDTPITPLGKGSQQGKGFAVFGDNFRDAIKGGVFDLSKGYVQAGINIDKIKRGIEGSINDFTASPTEAINYVASHDNHTLWDRLVATTRSDRGVTDADRKRMDKLAAALVLTSQGIPFLEGGQDLLRTKQGNSNSYNAPDSINAIRWEWKKTNFDVFTYYKGLIALRKAHPVFRMKTRDEVLANLKFFDDQLGIAVPPKCVGYRLEAGSSGDAWGQVLVLFNPNPNEVTFAIPPGNWTIVVDDDEAGTAPVKTGPSGVSGKQVPVPPISAMVLHS